LSALSGIDVPDVLPELWRDAARAALGAEPPQRVRQETPIEVDAERRAVADQEGVECVVEAAALLRG
jgi:hypothetical protein